MEIESFEETENILKLTILGEGHTLLNLLRYYLTASETIEYAGYTMRHPLETRSNMFIKTKEGTAKEALLASLLTIRNKIDKVEQQFMAALDKYEEPT